MGDGLAEYLRFNWAGYAELIKMFIRVKPHICHNF